MEYSGVTVLCFVFIFFLDSRPSIHRFLITSDTLLIDLDYLVTREPEFVSGPDCIVTAPHTREFVTETSVLGRVHEQFVNLGQSSFKLRNDIFLEVTVDPYLSV